MAKDQASPQTVGFLLVPGFAVMSYAAAVEPLRAANLISGKELYRWWNAAPGGKPVMASNGLAIIPDCGTNTEREADMVFVCAGGNPALFGDKSVFAWLRRLARRGVAIGGISGGPYLLAKAGLLDERRATLHWEHLPAFREAFPDVAVVPSLFEIDGNRITCSGGISALDMMVALIERDHGRQLAAAVGDWFLHTHIREGFGPQRMDLRYRLGVADEKLLAVLRAMEISIETPQPRTALARQAGISLRQLERLFHRYIGHGVHFHYRWLRLERARQLLRETTLPVLDVALATGFASASQFARAYARAFGEPPSRTRLQG
jgi:transcriptional regulator GlxA family with amidase domain